MQKLTLQNWFRAEISYVKSDRFKSSYAWSFVTFACEYASITIYHWIVRIILNGMLNSIGILTFQMQINVKLLYIRHLHCCPHLTNRRHTGTRLRTDWQHNDNNITDLLSNRNSPMCDVMSHRSFCVLRWLFCYLIIALYKTSNFMVFVTNFIINNLFYSNFCFQWICFLMLELNTEYFLQDGQKYNAA
jgi:hypothetical protein